MALTLARRGLIVLGDTHTLKCGYEAGLDSVVRGVYQRQLVMQSPEGQGPAALVGREGSIATARAIGGPSDGTEKTAAKRTLLQTAAAWQPHASCSDSPDLPAAITASMPCVDDLLNSRPFIVALAYSLDLPVRKYGTADLPDSVFEWDRKALSRTTIGALGPP